MRTGFTLTRTAVAALSLLVTVAASGAAQSTDSADPHAVSMAHVLAAARTAPSIPGLKPADIASAYGLTGGVSGTVGIVIPYDTPALESDLATYRSTFGLPACTTANGCFSKVDQAGGTSYPAVDAGWSIEASLDVQSVSAACPGCKILVVETANNGMASLGTGVGTAVSLGAQAVSMSWGVRENIDASYYQGRYFTHASVPMIAATGDSGYPQAYMPATFSNVIAVGGTTLSRTATSAAAVPRAVTATNGSATAAATLTPAQEHAAALAAAKADLSRAQAKAIASAKALTAAKKSVTDQTKLFAKASAKYKTALANAKRSHSPAVKRALRSAQKTYTAVQKVYRKATALVTTRNRALSAANTSVRACTASVSAAQAVVDADRATTASPVTPPVTSPVTPAPTQTGAPVVAPTEPVQPPITITTPPAPVVTPTPDPVPTNTTAPAPAPTPTPTQTPARTNTAPTASFGYTRTGLTGAFDASSSSDPDGSIASYAWNFGDGATASGVTASHTFAATGSYVVTLTVTDDEGATTSTYATVSVTAPTPPADPSAARAGWVETAWSGAGSGCSTYVDKPSWQTDTACSKRTVADVSAVGDPNTGLAVFATAAIDQGYTSDGWLVIGGTSLATPLISGIVVRSGHAANYSDASALYADSAAFWDVTSGSNGSCSGSPVCTAGVGYDGPTGLGTPKSLSSF